MNRAVWVFAASAVVGSVLAGPATANAAFERWTSTMYCSKGNRNMYWGSYGVSNPSTTEIQYYACGVPNDSDFNLTQVQGIDGTEGIKVVGDAIGNGTVGASACYTKFNAVSGTCGTWTYNVVSGSFLLNVDNSAWKNADYAEDLPYIALMVGVARSGTYNVVRGFWVRRP